ncbi:hypothetical protein Esti_000384 [Eimeria stiedai]
MTPHEAAGLFKAAVAAVLAQWTLLTLAVDQGWGGRDSHRKRQQLYEDLVAEFEQSKGPPSSSSSCSSSSSRRSSSNSSGSGSAAAAAAAVAAPIAAVAAPIAAVAVAAFVLGCLCADKKVDADVLADILAERLQTDFCAVVEDNSDLEVAQLLVNLHEQTSRGCSELAQMVQQQQQQRAAAAAQSRCLNEATAGQGEGSPSEASEAEETLESMLRSSGIGSQPIDGVAWLMQSAQASRSMPALRLLCMQLGAPVQGKLPLPPPQQQQRQQPSSKLMRQTDGRRRRAATGGLADAQQQQQQQQQLVLQLVSVSEK